MKCADVSSADKEVLPFVCRRIHHHDYEASTRVTFLPEHDAQSAGLLMMKDETHQYYLAKTRNAGNHCIVLRKISENGAEDLASSPIDEADHTVDLKVKSQGLTLSFFYSADGGRSWKRLQTASTPDSRPPPGQADSPAQPWACMHPTAMMITINQ